MKRDEHTGRKLVLGAGLLLGAGWLMSTREQRAEARRRFDPIAKVLFGMSLLLLIFALLY